MIKPDKERLEELITNFKALKMPNHKITQAILSELGLLEIVDLEFTMESNNKEERLAALNMILRHWDDLLSGDVERWKKAKKDLAETYYQIDTVNEEAFL